MKKYLLIVIILLLVPFITVEAKEIEVGDYIYIVPYRGSCTISKDDTGYSSNQTIKPYELNTWRVIKKNNDGTIEAVSEYISSDTIFMYGTTGYAKYIYTTNKIAQCYNHELIKSSRIMGYDGQTEIITNTSYFDGTLSSTPSYSSVPSPTSGTGMEYMGGITGDTLYLKDYLLVSNVYKSNPSRYGTTGIIAYLVNDTSTNEGYLLASRMYRYLDSLGRKFYGPRCTYNDELSRGTFVQTPGFRLEWEYYNSFGRIRPIITTVENLGSTSGDGSLEDPYRVKKLNKSNIIINNDNDKGTIILPTTTNVLEDSIVSFTATPNLGYRISSFNIKNSNNLSITYQNNNSNEYSFIMSGSDVTITPIYEKEKYSINVEIVNETENINIGINDLSQVEFQEEVDFKVTAIKGYKVKNIKIIDENENEIEYSTSDNLNYTFTMPASDVTIIPLYEKVKNAVTVDENTNTKEIVIEVEDATAVVYENKVKFTVTPEDGYEVETIEIMDKENNRIDYRKTNKENEYEFTMPDTDVIITPVYKKIEVINTITNPETDNRTAIIIFLLTISIVIMTIIVRNKKRFSNR